MAIVLPQDKRRFPPVDGIAEEWVGDQFQLAPLDLLGGKCINIVFTLGIGHVRVVARGERAGKATGEICFDEMAGHMLSACRGPRRLEYKLIYRGARRPLRRSFECRSRVRRVRIGVMLDRSRSTWVKHRFLDHRVDPQTEFLIVGTFNPDADKNPAKFFYGRPRNYLWKLLPGAFGHRDLRGSSVDEKLEFIRRNKIDFIDLIERVEVQSHKAANYSDRYLDKQKICWRNISSEITGLRLKRAIFTRKTFGDVPNIRQQVDRLADVFQIGGIPFRALSTPARFYDDRKQKEWNEAFQV
jgi:G:T/U-mismatch repair DNA glycosylase